MDWDFYEALEAYEDGDLDRDEVLTTYPDAEPWLNEIDTRSLEESDTEE